MGASLVKLDDPGSGSILKLQDGIVVIGRSRTSDFCIDSHSVSKQHCQISRINDFYVVHDLNSRNGTSVNGKQVAEVYLKHGDQLSIGHVKFRFELDPPPVPPASAPAAARGKPKPKLKPKPVPADPGTAVSGKDSELLVLIGDEEPPAPAPPGVADAAARPPAAPPAPAPLPAAPPGSTPADPPGDGLLALSPRPARAAVRKTLGVTPLEEETLFRAMELLRGLDEVDDYADHSARVRDLALSIGKSLALPTEELRALRLAAILHDIGAHSATAAYRKGLALDPRGRADVEAHPARGADLARRAGCPEQVVSAIRGHHERLDGSGYPDRLRGTHIPRLAQILAVAEVVVGMSSDRPYRARRAAPEIGKELETGAGVRFAQDAVSAALKLMQGEVEGPVS
ncbi:MAG: FHA domain-containing protein [Planctomycetes bacterium]|nr:FHA domain-containing protein [Planctomycetota bacterium]